MRKKELLERMTAMLGPICQTAGVMLWDVTFEKEGRSYTLTVFIDRAVGGVFIEDCEAVSRALDPLLDAPEFNLLPPYTLSVSSAGVERRLVRPEHFAWAIGKRVVCTFYKPEALGADATGVLLAADGDTLTLELEGGPVSIPREKVSRVRMFFEF